ncbi:uncharacterized protein C8Q71DRAFT_298548 [Rhodofomes roseus]|uniref:Uncharacterized protein n=1 Tax=Rhodofomes roseus TaxID=34475 RepID=A0ABQ8K3S5_9APHY|nr:uncharacterized protein C8Q71DRAFT_298548 [Rhodofomes roseus]KAH9831333.1 hypothetical protein C8Q71DRAFT_298548 [Rhodofomes roseus]
MAKRPDVSLCGRPFVLLVVYDSSWLGQAAHVTGASVVNVCMCMVRVGPNISCVCGKSPQWSSIHMTRRALLCCSDTAGNGVRSGRLEQKMHTAWIHTGALDPWVRHAVSPRSPLRAGLGTRAL